MSQHENHDHDHVDEVDLLKWPDPLPARWTLHPQADLTIDTRYEIRESGAARGEVVVLLARGSRYQSTYPVGSRDRVLEVSADVSAEGIQLVSEHLMEADPLCRRLVLPCAEDDLSLIARAERAGYRYVVEVDLPEGSVSLLTAEPEWVLEQSRDIDIVPTA